MTSRRHLVPALFVVLAALGAPGVARSQAVAPQPWSLFSVRYDTRASDFIYAAYGYGRTFGMVGVLHNPRSGYSELLGAVGRTFRIGGGPAQSAALGVARASEGWYAQVYFLPAAHRGPSWVRATSELYVPLGRAGVTQLSLSPLSATVSVSRLLEVGVATDISVSQGARPSTALGPEVRLALPKAVLGADIQRLLEERGSRLRVYFTTAF